VVRSYLTLLLLLNYLLVVGAGVIERPARVVDRPFDYVHSHDCQLRHTLRLACFDDCNGVQYQVDKQGQRPPLHQLLTMLKGLDKHCLSGAMVTCAAPSERRNTVVCPPAWEQQITVGHRDLLERPPRRG
jgi:hypothetical protein